MERERVTLSAGEQRRVMVLNHLEKGAVILGEAAGLLGISERQVKRLRAAYRQEGAAGLVHGNRGRRPA
ncbi:MAG TPA: helix-turn-helix domain-containing protein, partial [Candidatus Dormibacteraeota bacterium]|nr:helix-turn-helix domain-containing protein [Candidatus Dormibacteraeota bacterium]